MTLQQIKQAVRYGNSVHWKSDLYQVVQDGIDQWLIICRANNHCIGLTWRDGETLNGEPADFYVSGAR